MAGITTPQLVAGARPQEPAQRPPEQAGEAGRVGGTGSRLLRFALANIRRRPERFILSTLGIALAIMVVTVVRTISTSVGESGTASLDAVLGGDPLWVVPAAGVHHAPALQAFLADGPAPPLRVPEGWTARQTLTGVWRSPAGRIAVYGRDGTPAGTATVGAGAAAVLGLPPTASGDPLVVAGHQLRATVAGEGRQIVVTPGVARDVGATGGWWTVSPPPADAGRTDLGTLLSAASGIPATVDPAARPGRGGPGLIYDTVGGSSALTFSQRFSALFAGQVTGSALGVVSTIGLVLGFVIAVSSFLASVQERRREFGIMSSIGLADEVLYFFLIESAVVFAVAYLAGVLLAGAAVVVVVPGLASLSAWAQAAGTVAAYLPAMAIVGALIPVHRLLQQRPVALLAEAS